MIRNLSIKKKITIWFSLSMIFIVGIMMGLIFAISQSVFNTDIQTQLVNQVNTNAEEIEYLNSLELKEEYEMGDHFLEFENGYLEIDDDFCYYVNGIYTCLVDSENNLIYGESPIRLTRDQVFTHLKVEPLKYQGEHYYIFERPLHGDNLDGLWVRGVASRREGTHLLSDIMGYATWLLPALALFSVLMGYLITRRSFAPAEQIIAAAESITGGNDLSRRITLPDGRSEFNTLADSYNRMFDRLEASFQREKQFTSDVSHELRTPASVILTQCEFSLEMEQTPEEYREALEVIQQQGLKMKDLISQLLFISRLEQGREPLQIAACDLSSLVTEICAEQSQISDRGITLLQNIQPELIAPVDPRLFSRVVTNLISNAYKYGRPGGRITVSLTEADGQVRLQVCDDGIGIAAEHLPKIFDRFYQVDAARTSDGSAEAGAGLGLAMVREITELHRSQISVESVPGEGSTFTVTIPAHL